MCDEQAGEEQAQYSLEAVAVIDIDSNSDSDDNEDRPDAFEQRRRSEQAEVDAIISDTSPSFAQQIDKLAEARNWFCGDTTLIDSYLAGRVSREDAVEQLTAPVDHLYSTAEEGRAYYSAEGTARHQRTFHKPEKALELWGPQESYPKPTELPEDEYYPSCEGMLWNLWYSVLHAAKKVSWDSPQQEALLELVQAVKKRPDPPAPVPMTIPLSNDWIWSSGKIWSVLLMLGPSARETWNDSPGCGAGWTKPEVSAWLNVSAFVARLTRSDTSDFRTYGLWALRDALEENITGYRGHKDADYSTTMNTHLSTATIWIKIAGEFMYKASVEGDEDIDTTLRERKLPWNKTRTDDISLGRWKFWRVRFEEESRNSRLDEDVRQKCKEAVDTIAGLEARVGERKPVPLSTLGTMVMLTPVDENGNPIEGGNGFDVT